MEVVDSLSDLFGIPTLDPHSAAWFSKDYEAVQKLADSYKETTERTLFKIVENLSHKKEPYVVDVDGDYSKFMIDNALSQYVDCLPYVNMMNLFGSGLSDQIHHDYYMLALPKEKRFSKWATYKEEVEDKMIHSLISKHQEVDYDTAKMYRGILEGKGKLKPYLNSIRFMVNDEFIKSVSKTNKDKKLMMEIVEGWKND